jgi:hypothetical protein
MSCSGVTSISGGPTRPMSNAPRSLHYWTSRTRSSGTSCSGAPPPRTRRPPMSSREFERFPTFEPGGSTAMALACGLLGLATIGALFVAQIEPVWKFSLLALVVSVTVRTTRPGTRRTVALRRLTDGRWSMFHADGRTCVGHLHRGSVAHPWLCVVVIADGWRRMQVTIPADALSRDDHRRLRVWLRWCPTACALPTTPWSPQSPSRD